MPEQQTLPDVRKSVTVEASPEHCFKVFTERPADWWPPHHLLLKKERAGLAFEPRVGGRYYEWDVEGNEAVWGTILEWQPGRRLHMTWRIDGTWQPLPDDRQASEIEVFFTAVTDTTTRVELAHVKIDRVGESAQGLYRGLAGPSPGDTLERFSKAL